MILSCYGKIYSAINIFVKNTKCTSSTIFHCSMLFQLFFMECNINSLFYSNYWHLFRYCHPGLQQNQQLFVFISGGCHGNWPNWVNPWTNSKQVLCFQHGDTMDTCFCQKCSLWHHTWAAHYKQNTSFFTCKHWLIRYMHTKMHHITTYLIASFMWTFLL